MLGVFDFLKINKSSVEIPDFLLKRKICNDDVEILQHFFDYFQITTFAEINIEILNDYAKINYDSAIQVNTLLGLYGIKFIGKSSLKYSPNTRNKNYLLVSLNNTSEIYDLKIFQAKYKNLELKFLEYFEKIGIQKTSQITGINLSTLLDKLNLKDVDIDLLCSDINTSYLEIKKENLENFYSGMNQNQSIKTFDNTNENSFFISEKISNTTLSVRTVNCLLRCGITTIDDLLDKGIKALAKEKNVGEKTLKEIDNFLQNMTIINSSNNNSNYDDTVINIETKPNNKKNNRMPLDKKIYDFKLNNLEISYQLKNKLANFNMNTIGNFLENNKNSELSYNDINNIYKQLELFGIDKKEKYYPVEMQIPDLYFKQIADIFDDNWIIEACKKHNLKNIGLLASKLDNLINDDELASQEEFLEKNTKIEKTLLDLGIEQIPIKISYFQEIELRKKELSEIIETNYINELFDIFEKILNNNMLIVDKKSLKEKEIDIIKKRFGIEQKEHTLEEVGQLYGVSRERIRQLESKTIKKFIEIALKDLEKINDEIANLLSNYSNIVYMGSECTIGMQNLIIAILKNMPNRSFDVDFKNKLILIKNLTIENINDQILNLIDNTSDSIKYEQIKKSFDEIFDLYLKKDSEKQKNNYEKIYELLFKNFINEYFVKFDDNLYRLINKNSKRRTLERDDKIIYWFKKLYPQGIHLPIEKEKEDLIKQSLQPLYEHCQEIKELNTRFVADRLIKSNKEVIWWGRGLYIHVENIEIDWAAVDFAISEIIKKFDNGLYRFKPRAIYDEHKSLFINANIPHDTALMGLIRYKNHPRINTKRDELRDINNSNLELNILETFEQFILKYPNGINKKELMDEMCNKRGWKPYQIEFLYNRSNLVYYDNGIYYHNNTLTLNNEKLLEIIDIIQEEMDKNNSSFIHLRKIQNKYPVTWAGVLNKNISPSFMGRLLNNELLNKEFIIDNYVYIKKMECLDKKASMLNILSKFVEEKSIENKYVTISEIIAFCQKQGIKDTKQPIVDCVLKFSFEYDEEVYVHKNVLGFSEESQEDIFALVQQLSEMSFDNPLISYEYVILQYRDLLPALEENYDWNYYLLRSALNSNEKLDIFDKTFIFKENKFGVEDLDDTAAYLMIKNCENGYCKIKELDKLLAQNGVTPYKNLHHFKSKLFFEGSSIKLVDNESAVAVEKFARDKYFNV